MLCSWDGKSFKKRLLYNPWQPWAYNAQEKSYSTKLEREKGLFSDKEKFLSLSPVNSLSLSKKHREYPVIRRDALVQYFGEWNGFLKCASLSTR